MRSFVWIFSGTNRGRLLLFDAVVRGQVVESNEPIKEHVETKLIVKVAHEVNTLDISSHSFCPLIVFFLE